MTAIRRSADHLPGLVPWRRPRRERVVLLLVALATLTPVYFMSAQDSSRLCLSRSLLAGQLAITSCTGLGSDRASYDGRLYSDKAPGLSLLAIPAVAATRLPSPVHWHGPHDVRLWLVRLSTNGLAFVLLVFVLGRVAEGLSAGTGSAVASTFALGTLAGGLAATTFDQPLAASLLFGAFAFAWRRRDRAAGLLAGFALAVEYQAGLGLVVLVVYIAVAGRLRLLRFLAATIPGVALLAAYDWASFGSPFHASYRYVANGYARAQASGYFGIGSPRPHSVLEVLVGNRGLLVASPVLIFAAIGLVALARVQRREAVVCATITVLFLLLEFGYFLPYGGVSPGPRFLLPALPFLALGLAPAFRRFRTATTAVALVSIIASRAIGLTWARGGSLAVLLNGSAFRHELASSVFGGAPVAAAIFGTACAVCALAVSLVPARLRSEDVPPTVPARERAL